MCASLHYNLHLCQMNPAAEILIGFYGLYTQWCLCMWVWGVRQRAFTEAWRKRKKIKLKNEWKWKNYFGCWGSVGLSGILFLSLSLSFLFPLPHISVYFTSLLALFLISPSMSSYLSGLLVFRINDYLFPFHSLICSRLQWMCFFPEALRVRQHYC